MAIGTLGDAYLHKRNIQDMVSRKAKMQEAKEQSSSGLKYTKLRELGGQMVLVSSMTREMKRLEGFIQQNQSTVKSRVEGEELAVRNIQEEAIKFKTSLVLFNDGTSKDPTSFLVGFKQHLKTIEREGNTKVGDSYILGGTITNVPPFDVSKVADGLAANSGVTLDYYNGNSVPVSIAIDLNDTLECDLVGKHSAFEKLIRALKIANDSSIVSGDVRVNTAQTLVDEAIIELGDLVSQIGSKEAALDATIESQEDKALYLSDLYQRVIEISPEEAATVFMKEQVTLSMDYAMMSRLSEMSLVNYLK